MKCKKMCQDDCVGFPSIDKDGYVKCCSCGGFLNPKSLQNARDGFKEPKYKTVSVNYKKTYNPFYFQSKQFWVKPGGYAEEVINDEM